MVKDIEQWRNNGERQFFELKQYWQVYEVLRLIGIRQKAVSMFSYM